MGTEVDLHLALACQHLLWNGPPGGPERSPVLRACTTSTARPRGPANLTRSLAEPGPSREALMAAVRAQPARLSIGSLQRPGERAVTRARWHPQQPVFRPGRRGCDTAPGAAHDSMGCRLRADAPLVRTIAVANYCTGARVRDVDSVVILGWLASKRGSTLAPEAMSANRVRPMALAVAARATLAGLCCWGVRVRRRSRQGPGCWQTAAARSKIARRPQAEPSRLIPSRASVGPD